MTKDEIIKLARESGIDPTQDTLCRHGGWETPIEAFARACYEAGRTAERSACAGVCTGIATAPSNAILQTALKCAEAIRARGKP